MQIEDIARVTHEANRALCKTLGDKSQVGWEFAPDWQRESAISGVRFHLDNPDATPEASHESWLKEKLEKGWVYGDLKDEHATPPTHPCIKPYNQLPPEQQAKDHLFRAIVHALAPFLTV